MVIGKVLSLYLVIVGKKLFLTLEYLPLCDCCGILKYFFFERNGRSFAFQLSRKELTQFLR